MISPITQCSSYLIYSSHAIKDIAFSLNNESRAIAQYQALRIAKEGT